MISSVTGERTDERVMQAAREWVWIPDGALRDTSEDLDIVAYPAYFAMPTQVLRTSSRLPFDDLLARARGIARDWGRDDLFWWVAGDSHPADLEDRLLDHGAVLAEETAVLAIDLRAGVPSLDVPADVSVRLVTDAESVRDAEMIAATAFETSPTPVQRLPEVLAEVRQSWRERSGFRSVAYVQDSPAATGGCTLAGDVARLWGAGSLPVFRGRGAYRAVLTHRLTVARELGATLGLVKGRTNSSGPILQRAGFIRYGEERSYRITA